MHFNNTVSLTIEVKTLQTSWQPISNAIIHIFCKRGTRDGETQRKTDATQCVGIATLANPELALIANEAHKKLRRVSRGYLTTSDARAVGAFRVAEADVQFLNHDRTRGGNFAHVRKLALGRLNCLLTPRIHG